MDGHRSLSLTVLARDINILPAHEYKSLAWLGPLITRIRRWTHQRTQIVLDLFQEYAWFVTKIYHAKDLASKD
jgi:hypothetical protein